MHHITTREDYALRLHAVVAHIDAHLDEPLDLDALAGVAHFSRFHFHRMYRQGIGETPEQTVRRLRLHRAACALGNDADAISTIAQRAGYQSTEAFSRAFSSAYGQAPSVFRAQRQTKTPSSAADRNVPNRIPGRFAVTVQSYAEFRLCGLAHNGSYNGIGTTFERVFALASGNGLMQPQTRCIGVYLDDPETTPEPQLRSFAGIVVPDGSALPAELSDMAVPGGLAASLVFQGPYSDLHRAYRFLYGEWLPDSGHEPADLAVFEEYLNNPKQLPPGEWLTEIRLPLCS